MALLFMDSFDHYATADITEKWTSRTGSYESVGAYGRNSTNGLRLGGLASNIGYVTATCIPSIAEVIVAAAVKVVDPLGSGSIALMTVGTASAFQAMLVLQNDGSVRTGVYNATDGNPGSTTFVTLIGAPSSQALQLGVWTYIEWRIKVDSSAGTSTVRFNGIEVLAETGLDTQWNSAVLSQVAFSSRGATYGRIDLDDVVVMDTSGSYNNSFLGDVTVTALFPSGAGTTSGWTPSAGSNYDNVNESAPNDDTDYNSTSTINAKDTYAMQDCAAGADIRAVQILASVRKGSEGPGQVKLVTRSNSTDYDGTAQGIGGTSYSYVREIRETDPATAAAWSESGWNAVEIGLKKTG